MTETTNSNPVEATRKALADALRKEIDAHRVTWSAHGGGGASLVRIGMRRALDIVKTAPVPVPHPELGAPMPPHRPEPSYDERPADGLTQQQLDGFACVECGVDAQLVPSMVPAGYVAGSGQLFRCSDAAACPPPVPGHMRARLLWGDLDAHADPAKVARHVDAMASPAPELAPAAPVLPGTVWVVRATGGPVHPAEGVYLSDVAALAAARVIAGEDTTGRPGDDGGVMGVRTVRGQVEAKIFGLPLHTDDTPHGLPVVGQAAVTAALDGPLPRDMPEDAAPRLSFGDALASFFAYIDGDEDDDTTEGGAR